jgi:hypothetical protein
MLHRFQNVTGLSRKFRCRAFTRAGPHPGVGVPRLRRHFPDRTRPELTDLLQRYREVVQCKAHS